MSNIKPDKEYDKYHKKGKNYHWKWLENPTSSYNKYIRTILNDVLNLIDKTNSEIIIDAGCGDGELLYLLHENKNNLKLYGFDFIESAIKYAKKKLKNKVEVFTSDLRDLDNLDMECDLIISTETIDHVLPPYPLSTPDELRIFHIEILEKLIKMAKKGAYFTIPATKEWRSPDHNFEGNNEPLLEEWLKILGYNTNWKYLSTDKNNPKGTYIVEIIK